MTNEEIKEAIDRYEGTNTYLKLLRNLVRFGATLTEAQLTLAKKFLVTVAVKSNDKTLLPTSTIVDMKIDWDKYSARMPYDFQKVGINWLLNKNRALLTDSMGCIDGEALININRAKSGETITFRELYYKYNGLKGRWNKNIDVYATCNINNQLYKRKILGVYYNGQKKVLKITLEDGKTLKATQDHIFYKNDSSEIVLEQLKIGDLILTNGNSRNNTINNLQLVNTHSHGIIHNDRTHIKKTVPRALKIINIEDEDETIDVYDMTVDEAHNYVANGIIVHNCGKSIQSIIAALEGDFKKVLIVCPNSLKFNWKKEIEVFCNDIYVVKDNWDIFLPMSKFTVINYDKLHKYSEHIINKCKFDLIIADEAHFCKNSQALRSKHFMKIANNCLKVWLLTGTPISNRPIDFYNLLKICKHELGRRKDIFGEHYCNGKLTNFGWDYSGASHLKELHFKIQDVMLRRTKEEVLELPSKIRTPIYFEFEASQLKRYKKAVDEKFQELFDKMQIDEDYNPDLEKGAKFIELSVMRMFTALEKVRDGSTIEAIQNIIDQGKKVVVFTNFTSVIDTLITELNKKKISTTFIDGRVKIEERQTRMDLFQSKNGPSVFICNYKVGGVGVTLTAAEIALMNDLPWEPSTLQQAEDRLFRIGQTKSVNILYPLYQNTIDETIFTFLREKIKNIDIAIEGKKEVTKFSSRDVLSEVYYRIHNNKL